MIPKRLQRGDIIGIVAPSAPLIKSHHEPVLEKMQEYLKAKGFEVMLAEDLFDIDKLRVSGGSPGKRASDINDMFADPKIKAIWCYQGGGAANQVLDLLDYNMIKNNPKIFMGKSDIDVLLMAINKMTGLITFHTPDAKLGREVDMDFEYSQKSFEQRLIEGKIGEIEPATEEEWKCIREGSAEGRVVGCNVGALLKLAGTKYFPDFENAILFMEEYKPTVKEVISQLTQLKQLGVFDKISGIVIGYIFGFQDGTEAEMQPKVDEEGKKIEYERIVDELTKGYDFPILKINEFGHYFPNTFLPIGAEVKVDATNKTLEIADGCVK